MGRPSEWRRIAARKLDKRIYGAVNCAYDHLRYAYVLLVDRKSFSRRHPKFKSHGMWAVIAGTTVVHRKPYWYKAVNLPPATWANKILRTYLEGIFAREW